MRKLLVVCVASSASWGCTKESAPPSSRTPPPSAPSPSPAAAPATAATTRTVDACPTGADRIAIAQALFGTTAPIGDLTCTAAWVENHTMWLFTGHYQDAEYMFHNVTASRAAGYAKVLWIDDVVHDQGLAQRFDVADLDGDGEDELLAYEVAGGEGIAWERLHVKRVVQGEPKDLASIALRYETTGAHATGRTKRLDTCLSQVELAREGKATHIVVRAGKRVGKPDDQHCPVSGSYAFDGKQLTRLAQNGT